MAYAKFSFFEAATQHGYVLALMQGRIARSRETYQFIVDPHRGRVFQVFKTTRPETPFFEFVVPERLTTESNLMWRGRAKRELDKAWKDYEKGRSGKATTDPSESTPLSPTVSSTDAPPKSASSSGESEGVEPEAPDSGPGPSTPESSPTEPTSSKPSAPQSRRSGSRSRSSSGA